MKICKHVVVASVACAAASLTWAACDPSSWPPDQKTPTNAVLTTHVIGGLSEEPPALTAPALLVMPAGAKIEELGQELSGTLQLSQGDGELAVVYELRQSAVCTAGECIPCLPATCTILPPPPPAPNTVLYYVDTFRAELKPLGAAAQPGASPD